MEIKNGTDIVFLPRFRNVLAEGGAAFLQRVYLHEELRDHKPERLAGIYAAKEAVMKALGLPLDAWHDVNITHTATGAPHVKIVSGQWSVVSYSISISHDGEYVIAQFVALVENEKKVDV